MADLTKEYLDEKLGEFTTGLKDFVRSENETLSHLVNNGFDHVQNQITELKAEFKTELRQEIGEVKKEMNTRFDDVDRKINQLDFKIEEVRDPVLVIEEVEIGDLQKRVGSLERSTKHTYTTPNQPLPHNIA